MSDIDIRASVFSCLGQVESTTLYRKVSSGVQWEEFSHRRLFRLLDGLVNSFYFDISKFLSLDFRKFYP